jgi:aminopeptidase-like protein
MKRHAPGVFAAAALVLGLAVFASAQLTTWFHWTFLPQPQMDEIIGEASGETAYHHVLEMAGYERDRKAAEYAGTFFEAAYVLERLEEYRIPGSEIVRYPGGRTWDGVRGELWEVSPVRQKLASYQDIRAMLATGSNSADVTAELVWVGDGRPKDLEGVDLEGKIVVTSGSASSVHNLTCYDKGALGVVCINSSRPFLDSLSIPWSGIRGGQGREAKFAFNLPPREGQILRDRLLRGEKITVRAEVESTSEDYEIQDVVCTVPGTDPGGEEIILTAHLFEGYSKFGANDNYSGSAVLLETARVLETLIREGRLPRPKRTVRVLWVPEFSGTIPWVNAHPEIIRRTLCNINLDMVGLQLTKSLSFMTVMRTTYGNPHYLNDVMENVYRYVGETNRSYVANTMSPSFSRRIVAPSGTEEPMYYYVGTHFGSSDHEVFNDWGVGVPGVVLNTWPDFWYHTSQDSPDKLDPTQLKRSIVLTAAAAYTIAAADDAGAAQIAAEIVGNAAGRIGHQLSRGGEEIKRADADALPAVSKKARGYIEASALNERSTLDSVLELASDKPSFKAHLDTLKGSVRDIERGALAAIDVQTRAAAKKLGVAAPKYALTPLEKRAATIVPKPTAKVREGGYRGYQEAITKASTGQTVRSARGSAAEIQLLCDGKTSALDIKKMLDTQFRQETGLETVLDYLEILKKAGLVVY